MADDYPIPADALDDRLAFIGTAGAGKTYTMLGAVERLLASGARAVIVDPLDVTWGLRLLADGVTASPFDVVIFGGSHADLPLNEHSGALLGETVATMRESCIISLGSMTGKASERRFMLAFLTAFYLHASGEPVHLIIDEADMFAPQRLMDKEGDAAKLLGQMETIVRRGRVKGFVPWLITQRPAVLSKDVLSQADGLIALKLTASQDRDAVGAWIEGQADRIQGKEILAGLPSMQRGQGVVWIPGRGVLETATFPVKATYDSSRTPKRGEVVRNAKLKPLDLGALRERLATVEAEVAANDPKTLRAENAKLRADLDKATNIRSVNAAPDPEAIKRAEDAAFLRGVEEGERRGNVAGQALAMTRVRSALDALRVDEAPEASAPAREPVRIASTPAPSAPPPTTAQAALGDGETPSLAGPLRKIIDAIAWWEAFGLMEPSQGQVAYIAGYAPGSGTWGTYRARLNTAGLIALNNGRIRLTDAGSAEAARPTQAPSADILRRAVRDKLPGPLIKFFDPLVTIYPGHMAQTDWAEAAGYAYGSGTFGTYRSRLVSLEIVNLPQAGQVRAADWLFPDRAA